MKKLLSVPRLELRVLGTSGTMKLGDRVERPLEFKLRCNSALEHCN
jgi:hypothetical protein